MKVKPEKIAPLIEEVDAILGQLHAKEQKYAKTIAGVQPGYERSARNLIHYIALRSIDIRNLQKKLGDLGLSRLARAEAHVKASLLSTRFILHKLIDTPEKESLKAGLSIKKGEKLLKQHTKALLGNRPKSRRLRIMVTLPSEAAHDYALVHELAAHGMNCARINCAHDDAEAWKNMIEHVKKASQRFKRNIKITMDLAGPKIRTGAIKPGPRVRKFSPIRDTYGKVTQPAEVSLVPEIDENSPANALPVDEVWLKKLKTDDVIVFKDTRNKDRLLKVKSVNYPAILCHCSETAYVATGMVLNVNRGDMTVIRVGELPALPQVITLKTGDTIVIHKDPAPGEPAYYHTAGHLLSPAHISCSLTEVFGAVKAGEPIFFDDGKIHGTIKAVDKKEFVVEITHAKEGGAKLGADKGINVPYSALNIRGLSTKDKEDLSFIAKYADVVNFSFVNTPEDVKELLEVLQKLNALDKIGILLKIETLKAFNNLKTLLLAAMKAKHVGVMIARGDLAIETGWENIGKIQREILSICNAAHIPVVWATQVLENLAKKGLPSRAEITDAVTSLQAEGIMLNKGPYIVEAMQLLHSILSSMEEYQDKNASMLPELEKLPV